MPESIFRVLDEQNPRKAIEAFRALPAEDQLAAVWAENSILRYELRLGEEVVDQERRANRWLRWIAGVLTLAVLGLIPIGLVSLSNQKVLRSCTSPSGACYQEGQTRQAGLIYALVVEQDCRTRRALAGLSPPPAPPAGDFTNVEPCVFPTPEQERSP